MRLKVAVTGGNGFIGSEIVAELLRNEVDTLSLQRALKNNATVKIRQFDLTKLDNNTYKNLLDIDVVIHTAGLVHDLDSRNEEHTYLNFESTKRLFQICEEVGVTKFIFLSSVAVYGINSSLQKIDLQSNTSPSSSYGKAKLMSEKYLLDQNSKTSISILRLPLVYGINTPGNYGMLEKISKTKIPLPFLNVKNKRSMISVMRVAEVVAKIAINRKKNLGLHILVGKKSFSTEGIIKKLRLENGSLPMLFPFPPILMKLFLGLIGKKKIYELLYEDLEFISTIHN